ncbi:MAG TPA: hypothetical protein VFO54_01920, partial [Chryseosolibacter sp.]|nr:hypothetical protein [Chryseosolibacter sp.]
MRYVVCVLLLISGCKSQTKDENSQAGSQDTTSVDPVTEVYEPIAESAAGDVTVENDIFQFENEDIGSNPFANDFEDMVSALHGSETEKK